MVRAPVKLLLFATLRDLFGVKELSVYCENNLTDLVETAAEVLGAKFLDEVYDVEQKRIKDTMIVTVNGRNIRDLMHEPALKENDVVAIFPPVGGG